MKAFMAELQAAGWAFFCQIGVVVTVVKLTTAVYLSCDFLPVVWFEQDKTNTVNSGET